MPSRLFNEIWQIRNDSDGICKSTDGKVHIVLPENLKDDIHNFQGVFQGPPDSPYNNGIFTVSFQLPTTYPLQPPVVTFETKIWHPNVDFETGLVSLNILSGQDEWSTAWTLQSILLAIWSILNTPLLDLPINSEAANQYRSQRSEFEDQARFWTEIHAGPTARYRTKMLERFESMGFSAEKAKPILERVEWDEDRVVAELLLLK